MLNENFAIILKQIVFNNNGGYNTRLLNSRTGSPSGMSSNYSYGIATVMKQVTQEIHSVAQSDASQTGLYLCFGSSDENPENQYTMADEIPYGTFDKNNVTLQFTTDGVIITSIIKNVTESDITIKEVGLWIRCQEPKSPDPNVMIGRVTSRESEDLPITIKSGQTKVITFKIEV